jgi:hypothetical protein
MLPTCSTCDGVVLPPGPPKDCLSMLAVSPLQAGKAAEGGKTAREHTLQRRLLDALDENEALKAVVAKMLHDYQKGYDGLASANQQLSADAVGNKASYDRLQVGPIPAEG